MFLRLHKLVLAMAITPLSFASALAGPNGASVVAGSVTVQGQGTASVVVNQSSQSAIINWNTFNIGAGEKTAITMPGASSVELDRVTGNLGPSQIYGSLSSNGQVFLVNPDGILVGPSGKINTASFLATTHDIANSDFMAGHYNFSIPGMPGASVVNQGSITAHTGGFAALVAPGVRNTGIITAKLGTVALASGNAFTLDFYGDNLITLGVNDSIAAAVTDVSTGQPLSSLVSNTGTLKANGGRVELTAVAARAVVDSVINNTGVVEANTIGTHNGMIELEAATAANTPAGAPTQIVKVSGKVSAAGRRKGTTGGTVVITGENVQLSGATINASGRAGGGAVLIGGDTGGGNPSALAASIAAAVLEPFAVPTATTVSVDATSVINASATGQGNGGKVILWSGEATTFYGTILATGGTSSGNGGFVETSGQQLAFAGTVDAGAPNGTSGTVLLDPQDVTIGTTGTWVVTPAALEATLATSNALVSTDPTLSGTGDITVAQDVSWSSNYSLFLAAYRDIIINDGVTISNTGAGSLYLGAGVTAPSGAPWYGNGTGTIVFNGTGNINFSGSSGYVSFGYNPVGGYANPTDFGAHVTTNSAVPEQFIPYMWVNNVTDLQNISENLAGNYALANNIDASATASWNGGAGFIPIGTATNPFTGSLVGVAGSVPFISFSAAIQHLMINSSLPYVGLFGYVGPSGVVENIGLTNASVVAGDNSEVGAIAGQSSGFIVASFATGTVNGGDDSYIGGLVGVQAFGGSVEESYANVSVTGGAGTFVGGLVGGVGGGPTDSATVVRSYATGSVTGGNDSDVGGLLGALNSSVAQSYATGSVTGGSYFSGTDNGGCPCAGVGGLIGLIQGGNADQSYATGLVSGGAYSPLGGLVGFNYYSIFSTLPSLVTNSYWDTQSTGQANSANGVGFITSALKAGLPSGFDQTVWGSNSSINNGYPYLLWQVAGTSSGPTTLPPGTPSPAGFTYQPQPPGVATFPNLQTALFTPFNTQVAVSTPPVINNLNTAGSTSTANSPTGTSTAQLSIVPISQMSSANYTDNTFQVDSPQACLATVYTMVERAVQGSNLIPINQYYNNTNGAELPNNLTLTPPVSQPYNALPSLQNGPQLLVIVGTAVKPNGTPESHYMLGTSVSTVGGQTIITAIDPYSGVQVTINAATGAVINPPSGYKQGIDFHAIGYRTVTVNSN